MIEKTRADAANWDSFAIRCGASYRCAFHMSRVPDQDLPIGIYVRRFDIILVEDLQRRKIGQCALVMGWSVRIFTDQLQLLPEAVGSWNDIMQALLGALGSGRYRYGSEWSTEQPRDEDMSKLIGVRLERVRHSYLEAIEFDRWIDWDHYWRSVSVNVRRNFKKASDSDAPSRLKEDRSRQIVPKLLSTSRVRRHILQAKRVEGNLTLRLWRSMIRSVLLLQYSSLTTYRHGQSIVAYSSCIEFGASTFYMEGGSSQTSGGVGWLVLMHAIRRAFERSDGRGLFVMGPVDDETRIKPEWQGLALSRRHCRVTQRPIKTIYFSFGDCPG